MLPPKNFLPALFIFHLFPLHMPITLSGLIDAPFGKFASHTSPLNISGNIGWAAMEIVSPVTFLLALYKNDHPPLNLTAQILAVLYTVHYAHRAVVSPLILSPPRSPLHISVALAAVVFNLFNGYLLALGLAFYPPQGELTWRFYLGVGTWAIGFIGNVVHDEILNDLRRTPGSRLIISHLPEDDEFKTERYKVPRGGLFRWVSYPNYLSEWFEWAGWSLAASSSMFIALPPVSSLLLTTGPAHTFVHAISRYYWPANLLAPGWTFVMAEVTSMLPRAIRGHAWYQEKFGDKYPNNRKAVIPGIL
ncbi:hypothetical protein IAR50_001935 [Cryptococcus sp. DSM 104548]